MLRLFGFLILALLGAGGLLLIDFNRAVQQAGAAEVEPPSFQAYIASVPEKLVSMTGSFSSSASVPDLADMLPRAPEGWTARPIAEGDVDTFLPRSGSEGDAAGIDLVKAIAGSRVETGATVAQQVYERGERRVLIQLVRQPDSIFTSLEQADRRYELQAKAAEVRGRPFLTVRGLDVTEEFLGEGMRARYLTADVGAQIQIRVLASRRLTDEDLVPFFETLNVPALNASVVDRQPGLGEIPVLVLGSALNETDLAEYEADRAARAASAIRRAADLRDSARAELAATIKAGDSAPAGKAEPGVVSECRTVAGVKRCSVATGG